MYCKAGMAIFATSATTAASFFANLARLARKRLGDFGMSTVPLDLYESLASLWAPASRPLGFMPLKDYEDCFGAQLRCLKAFIPVGCSKQAPEVNWIIVASLPPGLDAEKGCGRPCTPRQHVHLKADIIHLSILFK